MLVHPGGTAGDVVVSQLSNLPSHIPSLSLCSFYPFSSQAKHTQGCACTGRERVGNELYLTIMYVFLQVKVVLVLVLVVMCVTQ